MCSWTDNMHTKEEIALNYKKFIGCLQNKINVPQLAQTISDAFCKQYTEIYVKEYKNRRPFIMIPNCYFWYVDFELKEPDPSSGSNLWRFQITFVKHSINYADKGEIYNELDFFYNYCNPAYFGILEKAILEKIG